MERVTRLGTKPVRTRGYATGRVLTKIESVGWELQ